MSLAAGLTGDVFGRPVSHSTCKKDIVSLPHFSFPRGGCTEAGITLFDKGPHGGDPFGLYK